MGGVECRGCGDVCDGIVERGEDNNLLCCCCNEFDDLCEFCLETCPDDDLNM